MNSFLQEDQNVHKDAQSGQYNQEISHVILGLFIFNKVRKWKQNHRALHDQEFIEELNSILCSQDKWHLVAEVGKNHDVEIIKHHYLDGAKTSQEEGSDDENNSSCNEEKGIYPVFTAPELYIFKQGAPSFLKLVWLH